MLHRLKSGELMSADSVHFADSLKCYTLKKHRVVYGGGGIMPDEFVPLDTLKYTKYHRQLAAKTIIITANLRYVDEHRKQLRQQYTSFADFRQRFGVFSESRSENHRLFRLEFVYKPIDKISRSVSANNIFCRNTELFS